MFDANLRYLCYASHPGWMEGEPIPDKTVDEKM
jgi:hypothetical protein